MKNLATMQREKRFETLRVMRENRDALIEVYKSTRETTPAETIKALVDRLGYSVALVTVAELVNSVSEYDGRISRRTRAWAMQIEDAANREELEHYCLLQPSEIHPCHIDQLGSAMMQYLRA